MATCLAWCPHHALLLLINSDAGNAKPINAIVSYTIECLGEYVPFTTPPPFFFSALIHYAHTAVTLTWAAAES